MVEQDFILRHVAEDVHHVALQILFVDDDFHALTAQHVGRTNQQWEAQFTAEFHGLVGAFHHPKLGVGDALVLQQGREAASVLSEVKGFVRRAHDLDAVALELFGEFERGLAS